MLNRNQFYLWIGGDFMSGLQAVEVMKKGNMVMRKTSLGTDMIYKFDQLYDMIRHKTVGKYAYCLECNKRLFKVID